MIQLLWPAVLEAGRTIFSDWKAKREDQRKIDSAVAENKARLALDQASHNHQWEMAQLAGADKWLRRVSFFIWSAPMLWATLDAEGARVFFTDTLAALPEWYVYGYLGISGAIWGVLELRKNVGILKR